MTRPYTLDVELPDGGKRITVKRACNGCGLLLGDVSEAEMERAIDGLPPEDVRHECPMCSVSDGRGSRTTGSSASGDTAPLGITRAPVSEQVRHLNGPMLARLRACAADTSPNWDGKVTIYPPEARDLVSLIDAALREAGRD